MFASLKDGKRIAVVLDTGEIYRGSGTQSTNRKCDIRKKFVEKDFIEAVILLPESTISEIAKTYFKWEGKKELSKVITNEETVKNDYNLFPTRYGAKKTEEKVFPVEKALGKIREAEEEKLCSVPRGQDTSFRFLPFNKDFLKTSSGINTFPKKLVIKSILPTLAK